MECTSFFFLFFFFLRENVIISLIHPKGNIVTARDKLESLQGLRTIHISYYSYPKSQIIPIVATNEPSQQKGASALTYEPLFALWSRSQTICAKKQRPG
jgi:hypothetical protein